MFQVYSDMPILIAHRGNTNGPDPEKENNPDYIDNAVSKGYQVEIDVWCIDGALVLGHDGPQYQIIEDYLTKRKDVLWCHAKNLDALCFLLDKDFHTFSHDSDPYTFTSQKIIWAYPGMPLNTSTICVMPERTPDAYNLNDLHNCRGICTDFVEKYAFILTS